MSQSVWVTRVKPPITFIKLIQDKCDIPIELICILWKYLINDYIFYNKNSPPWSIDINPLSPQVILTIDAHSPNRQIVKAKKITILRDSLGVSLHVKYEMHDKTYNIQSRHAHRYFDYYTFDYKTEKLMTVTIDKFFKNIIPDHNRLMKFLAEVRAWP